MSQLTEDQKLVWLGLRSPNQTSSSAANHIQTYKNNIASKWSTFQENFEDASLGSWSDLETWLTNNGVSSSKASSIRSSLELKFSSWSAYKDHVLKSTSWEEYESAFQVGSGLRSTRKTKDGESVAGVQIYPEGGVGRDGQTIPTGGIEVYGREVHFSQSGSVQATQEEDAGSKDPITYSNLSVPDLVDAGETFTASADVTNNMNNIPGYAVVEFLVDGSVEKSKTVQLDPNTTKTVSFEHYFAQYDTFNVTIGDLSPQEILVVHPALTS